MDNKIKILYISHSPYFNGAEICLYTLVKNINRDLFEPIVVFPFPGPLLEKIQLLGIKTYISPVERWIRYDFERPIGNADPYARSLKIAKIIDEKSIDIVHTNTSVVFEGAIAAKLTSIPHVWHIHEFLKGHPELRSCLPLPLIYLIIDYLSSSIVSVSNFVKEQFPPIINEDRIVTIYNGVEENKNLANSISFRETLGIGKEEIIAVTVGLLTEAKGYTNLLQAASIVRDKGIKIKFFWVGGSSKKMFRKFKSSIKKSGLKKSVFYLGFKEDIPAILKCSDFLICTSLMETLSLAVLEAMAAGLPVITTDCGGPSECVVNGVTGYVVPVNDPIKLSEKIIELVSDEQNRKKLGKNGLNRFMNNFSSIAYAEKFEDLYKKIVNQKKSEPVSANEKMIIESFLQLYPIISENHWKTLKK